MQRLGKNCNKHSTEEKKMPSKKSAKTKGIEKEDLRKQRRARRADGGDALRAHTRSFVLCKIFPLNMNEEHNLG